VKINKPGDPVPTDRMLKSRWYVVRTGLIRPNDLLVFSNLFERGSSRPMHDWANAYVGAKVADVSTVGCKVRRRRK
jgi:hypothetical protein